MPRAIQRDILKLGPCPSCGAEARELCITNAGKRLPNYVHRKRWDGPRLEVDRSRQGQALASYPLAKNFEWGPDDLTEPRVLPYETEQILEAEHEAGHR